MLFMSLNSNMKDATIGAGIAHPSGASYFLWCSCCFHVRLTTVLSVLRFKASGYPFGIFNLFLI